MLTGQETLPSPSPWNNRDFYSSHHSGSPCQNPFSEDGRGFFYARLFEPVENNSRIDGPALILDRDMQMWTDTSASGISCYGNNHSRTDMYAFGDCCL